MNLIPDRNGSSLSYWCSWHTQNIVAVKNCSDKFPPEIAAAMKQGDAGARGARMMLNEEIIFGEGGFADQFEEVRGDMYFMLDDGWDVDYGINPESNIAKFGSLVMSEQRFPSVKGKSPAERLKIINEKIKSRGWKGIGIWVAAQRSAEDYDAPFGEGDLAYWKERILWSREAGVEYWKVDWGAQAGNHDFRRALTEIGRELYPDLIVEHATCMCPLNAFDHTDPALRGRYEGMDWIAAHSKEGAAYSEVYRSYDVLNAMAIPTTLDRVAFLLQWSGGYVNGEDECFINAALGCPSGVMRSHYCRETQNESGDDRGWRLDEVKAALRWQRLAPAFGGTPVECSEEILFDDRFYREGDSWWGAANGKTVCQGAPAVVARNLPAASICVEGRVKPYVAASLNPNGAYAVAILPRVIDGIRRYPDMTVRCQIPDGVDTAGVFGVNCDVVLQFAEPFDKVYAQSLVGDEAVELTEGISGSTVTVTGEIAQRLFGGTDKTPPALVIRVAGKRGAQ